MPLVRPEPADALRPTLEQALAAWSARVIADHEQVERCREVSDPADYYAPVAGRFRDDPDRTGDAVLDVLGQLARADDTWLDIGAGGGRYALPLARRVREVIAVDPSAAMLDVLREGIRDHAIPNVRIVQGRWPAVDLAAGAGAGGAVAGAGTAAGGAVGAVDVAGAAAYTAAGGAVGAVDVALMAHVGYDVEAIGPFLDAAEAAARRACVAVLAEGAMTTVASLFWAGIHAEARVPLPALPELLALLVARGRLADVRLVDRQPPTFDTFDELLATARRQLWLAVGSERDDRLVDLLRTAAVEREGRWGVDRAPTRIGIVTWEPGDSV